MGGEDVLSDKVGLEGAGREGLVEALDVGVGGGVGAEDVGVAEDAGREGVEEGEDAGDGGGDGEGGVGVEGGHWGRGRGGAEWERTGRRLEGNRRRGISLGLFLRGHIKNDGKAWREKFISMITRVL